MTNAPQKAKIKKRKNGTQQIRKQFINFNFFWGGGFYHKDKFAF
jgi:hypothetical protein